MAHPTTLSGMKHTEFRDWRKGRDLTQQACADLLGLSVGAVRAYETPPKQKAKHRPVPPRLVAHLKVLDVLAQQRVKRSA